MKKLISIILSLCLLLTFAAAENAPAVQETAEKTEMTEDERYDAGVEAVAAGDYGKAKELFEQGAEKGGVRAPNGLGILYEQGLGVEQDFGKAAEYYRLSADLGFDAAQYNLGTMYADGRGVEQSYEKAREYFHPG